jgi:ribosomal protein L6P/L9E
VYIFEKIKFKGKGYYLYKSLRNVIAPQFGYSHRVYIYSFFTKVKFLTKSKLIIFGTNKNDVLLNKFNLKKKRPINIFTGKGVRFASEIIYKKTGKVSSYR